MPAEQVSYNWLPNVTNTTTTTTIIIIIIIIIIIGANVKVQ